MKNLNKLTTKQLEKICYKVRTIINERSHKKDVKRNKKYIGKYFRYRNCYSCPQDDSDYWWCYHYIHSIGEDGNLISQAFEKDKYGKIFINDNFNFANFVVEDSRSVQISPKEFYDEFYRICYNSKLITDVIDFAKIKANKK